MKSLANLEVQCEEVVLFLHQQVLFKWVFLENENFMNDVIDMMKICSTQWIKLSNVEPFDMYIIEI
jgi:hypothetical protein